MSLQDDITALTAKVTAETTVEKSAVTLLQGLSAKVADLTTQLTNAGASPDQLAAIEALTSQIDASTQDLAAAVAANTPAGGTAGGTTQPAA